jgi:hypothetical protein
MRIRAAVVLLTTLVATTTQARADWQVWTETQTKRALRDATPENVASVELSAARNEWESFQILMRSETPVRSVNVEPGDLKGPDEAIVRAADARLFRQHQFQLTVPTYRYEEFYNEFRPNWYPDALIPFDHPVTRERLEGARYQAVPFDLPASESHGFWIDLYVPATAQPGTYHGTYRVTAEGREALEVPVELTVWDFQLPRVAALRTALGSPASRMRSYYRQRSQSGKEEEPGNWDAVDEQVAELLSRNRINATPAPGGMEPALQPDGSYRIPKEQIDAFREFVDRYHVNTFRTARPTSVVKDPVAEREKLHAWLAAWDRAAVELDRPEVLFYTYLRDEPNDEQAYRFVQQWGLAIREAKSVVKVMVVEQTWSQKKQWGDLYGAVDIWCPLFSLFKPASAAKRRAAGETIWTYTALCQMKKTPWWHTDFPLLNYRVPAWIAWRYRITGILYWGGMSNWRSVENPWTDPGTLDRRDRDPKQMYNGGGSLLYPGRAVGFTGVVPSLRVKALRDAIDDYDYLAILDKLGLRAEAEKLVLPLANSWNQWEPNPAAYQEARARLAQAIVAAK